MRLMKWRLAHASNRQGYNGKPVERYRPWPSDDRCTVSTLLFRHLRIGRSAPLSSALRSQQHRRPQYIRCVGVWSTLIDAVDCSDSGAVITLIQAAQLPASSGCFVNQAVSMALQIEHGVLPHLHRTPAWLPQARSWHRTCGAEATWVGAAAPAACSVHWPSFCVASYDGL